MAGKAYQAYMDAIKEFGSLTASPTTAFEKAASTFAEDEAAGQSPFFKATDAIDDLKTALGHEQAPLFWNWISGPVDVAWRYALNETGCRLQKLWESRVLAEVRGATDRGTINKMLLGQDGFAWQFVKGDAAPFLDRSRAKGYFPRKRYGGTVPFDESFLNYINRGAVQQVVAKDQYRVQITALPVNVNESARYQPHATRLILRCADKDQTLLNLMFPVSETFIWKPASCGDVILEVEVHDAVLSRRYTGDYAFPRFLREFSRGQQRFGPEDFEGSRNVWQRLGMTSIQIQYKLQGHRQPIRLLGGGVPRVPQSIAGCW
jgi:type VI secretion system protein ImpL